MLMNSLFMIVELMLSIFLERTTRKTDKNSSMPASQSDRDDTVLGAGGANGKGKRFASKMAGNTRTRQTVTVASVDVCEVCGEDLSHTACQGHERRTKIDWVASFCRSSSISLAICGISSARRSMGLGVRIPATTSSPWAFTRYSP